MSVSARELLQLKEKVSILQEQYIRAEAAVEAAVNRLKDLGYDSVEDAEAALEDMQKDITNQEAKLAQEYDKILDKYPALIEE